MQAINSSTTVNRVWTVFQHLSCFSAFAIVSLSLVCPSAAEDRVKVKIPMKDEVGAKRLPALMAPIEAPFAIDLGEPLHFPSLQVSIIEHGATPEHIATEAIQAAIDAVHTQGGGTVTVPSGRWTTGRISLKSNVNLHIAEGAELHFSGAIKDYRPAVFTRNEGVEVMSLGALIYANGQSNIAVTGKGKLVGPPMECEVRKQVMNASVIENFIDAKTPVEQRIYEGHDGGPIFLPMFISPINCQRILIEGVTLEQTAFWNIVPVYCDGVIIRGVTVNSVGIPRGDGIDIESSRNVLIEYSTLNCGDDCFTMKAGRGDDGLRVGRPTENVVVRYCLAREGHGGITLGSETAGWIRNLYLHDCVFDGTGVGIRFKTRRPRGGGGENVILERIRMDISGTAITADMLGSSQYVGDLAKRLPKLDVNALTPSYRNVTIRDIVVENCGQFMKIRGIPESPFTNFQLSNADVKCDKLIDISDAENFHLENMHVECTESEIKLLDMRKFTMSRVDLQSWADDETVLRIQGEHSSDIRFLSDSGE